MSCGLADIAADPFAGLISRAGRASVDARAEREAEAAAALKHGPLTDRLRADPDGMHDEAARAYGALVWYAGRAFSDADRKLYSYFPEHLAVRVATRHADVTDRARAQFGAHERLLTRETRRVELWLTDSLDTRAETVRLDGTSADQTARTAWLTHCALRLAELICATDPDARLRKLAGAKHYLHWQKALGVTPTLHVGDWQAALSSWMTNTGARPERMLPRVQAALANAYGLDPSELTPSLARRVNGQ